MASKNLSLWFKIQRFHTIVWVFFTCTNFPGINIQGNKQFSWSHVIAKIKRTKILLRCRARDLMEFRVDVYVRGQHIYQDIWCVVVGEVLVCKREPNNFQDKYPLAVKKKNSVRLLFAHKVTCENILTAKITQTTVCRNTVHVCIDENDLRTYLLQWIKNTVGDYNCKLGF